ncbi:hypothetical protein N7478_000160 [Penicillium angulare]|uniref:uncharacterized protein n=1 Tax=Penicillium angulare TaxID=116970 RepID=UPI0025405B1F|nr:uncharacterized protein N7478_000160 [Penicillium angulare]KAJ5290909.1 hypothetical protein N7478_000160 [Penicillium angulare]
MEISDSEPSHKRRKTYHDDDSARQAYTIAWICALPIEMAAARAVLDDTHDPLPTLPDDDNTYVLGNINEHNIVIACLPTNQYGIVNAANVVTNLKRTFTSIRVGLMVGIGGGVPSKVDIRLGDVVVGTRVMQIDLGKIVGEGQLERTAIARVPHQSLGTAVSSLRAKHEIGLCRIPSILQHHLEKYGYGHPNMPDHLFQAPYHHPPENASCDDCDKSKLALRSERLSKEPMVHYGAVASGSQVIKNSVFRDEVARQLNVICFEMEAAGLMDILPCLPVRGICDYSDSHKSKEWQRYAAGAAAAYARELLEEIPIPASQIQESQHKSPPGPSEIVLLQDRRKQLLDSLRFTQIDSRRLTVKKEHAKTCQWFLTHPDYKAWLDPKKLVQHYGLFWVSGKPGSGKSTIMKFIYSNMKQRRQVALKASFFFNARGTYLEKSVLGMYRSLLLQLLEGFPDLQTVLDDPDLIIANFQKAVSSLDILKKIIFKAVSRLGHRTFTCFIDALDECDEQQVLDMVQYFEDLACYSLANQLLFRVCFSSRHYPFIIIRYGTRLVLEHQPGHTEDLEVFVKSQLRAQDAVVIQKLLEKAAGVFMWVVLVVEILNKEYARGAMSVHRRLEETPSDLSDLFKDILKRDNEDMEQLLLCFLWILCANRPLQPEEFYHATWSGLSLKGLVDDTIPDASITDTNQGLPRSYRYVISCSKGLAEVTKSDKPVVQFIHESVSDFLIKDRGLYEMWPEFGLDWESLGHEKLKICCNFYITHKVVGGFTDNLTLCTKDENQEVASCKYPFLEYACQSILHHSNAAAKVVPQDDFISSFSSKWIIIHNLFEKSLKSKMREYSPKASLLYIFADRGHPELIRAKLKDNSDINIHGERYKYPIFAALSHGDKASVAALLDIPSTIWEGVDITEGLNNRNDLGSIKDQTPLCWAILHRRLGIFKLLLLRAHPVNGIQHSRCDTPLSLALNMGDEVMAQLLIKKGADVNAATEYGLTPICHALDSKNNVKSLVIMLVEGGADVNQVCSTKTSYTPLLYALYQRQEDAARFLIEKGAFIDKCSRDGDSPLLVASRYGTKEFVKFLIEHGADIHKSNGSGHTPLALASAIGNEAIARLLIEHGADIHKSNDSGDTPLALASEFGKDAIARLLIEHGADIHKSNDSGDTPLALASRFGNGAIARLLIEHGADIHKSNGSGHTPLALASAIGNEAIARLLIEHGADIHKSNDFGYTPLALASRFGNEAIGRLLIEHGADIHKSNDSGDTPLALASEFGNEAIARLLIEHGADIHKSNDFGYTPLALASRFGNEAIGRLLIEHGADIHKSNDSGDTPLALASEFGNEAIARLLIEHGADIHKSNDFGYTPLALASRFGNEAIGRLLIEHGADIHKSNDFGYTPLALASEFGNEAIARLLIEHGADIHKRNDFGYTPLALASEIGNEAIVRLLIEHEADICTRG